MFLVGELGATINADRSPFDRTLNSVFRDGGRMMQRLGTQMTMALTLPLAGAGALAIKTAADYEKLQTSMAVLNGSVEEGARQFERLQQFSARTPFQLQDLARAQNMLQGFGLSADEAFNSLSMIGDIAAVSGGSIEGIGIAFGQAAAEGRLMTRDIRQLINQGVPAIKLLADSMGVASDEIFDLAEAGEISFQDLQKAFQDATTEGGMFANGMQKQSQTISGLFSTLRDNVDIALGEIGKSLVDTFNIRDLIRDLTESIQEGINWFNSLSQETRRMAFYVAGLLGASGPIIAALGTLSLALGAISAPITGAVAAVAGGAALLIKNWETVENYFTIGGGAQMWEDLKEIVSNTVSVLSDLWDKLGDNIIGFTEKSFSVILQTIETTLSAINNIIATWTNVYNGNFEKAFTRAESSWRDHMGNLANIVQTGLLALREIDVLGGYKLWEWLGIIPDQQEINARYSETMKEAVKRARDEAVNSSEDVIIPADIDVSMPEIDFGNKINMFSGSDNPIDKANAKVQTLSASIGESLTPQMNRFRETAWNALTVGTEGMSLFEIATQGAVDRLTTAQKAGMQLGQALGNAFSQAALHAKRLDDILLSVAKQLASKALITGLQILLTGGIGEMGFFETMFGGFRANGGSVFAGNAYRVGETNQPEMFIPSTNGSIHPMTSGSGMPKRMQVSISGTLTGKGSDLRAVINESQHIDLS